MKTNREIWELVEQDKWNEIALTVEHGEWEANTEVFPPPQPLPDPLAPEPRGYSLLCMAAQKGLTDIVKVLLERGAKPGARLGGGETALMLACGAGHYPIVDLLLSFGADVQMKYRSETALMIATQYNYKDIVQRLLAAGARVDYRDPKGMSALSYAARGNNLEMVALLIEAGCPVDGRDLHFPVASRQLEIVRLLLSKCTEVNKRFDWPAFGEINKGDTPLLVAATDTMDESFAKSGAPFGTLKQEERLAIVDLLLAAGADVNVQRAKTGATPLILAVSFDEAEIAERLIRAGADPNAEYECQMVRFPISKPKTLREKTLSAVTMARMRPRNKKVRKLLLGEE